MPKAGADTLPGQACVRLSLHVQPLAACPAAPGRNEQNLLVRALSTSLAESNWGLLSPEDTPEAGLASLSAQLLIQQQTSL